MLPTPQNSGCMMQRNSPFSEVCFTFFVNSFEDYQTCCTLFKSNFTFVYASEWGHFTPHAHLITYSSHFLSFFHHADRRLMGNCSCLSWQSECLRNIMEDVAHYAAAFQSYLNSTLRSPEEEVALLSPTLGIIQSLRKVCLLCMCGRGKKTDRERQSRDSKAEIVRERENLKGNNIWKLPDEIFLCLYRTAPWCQMQRMTLQRYFFYSFFFVCSLFILYLSVLNLETDVMDTQGSSGVFLCVKLADDGCVLSPPQKDAAQMWGTDTFSNRQEMCKMLRGFYVRTITINRAMGYISSGDHRK